MQRLNSGIFFCCRKTHVHIIETNLTSSLVYLATNIIIWRVQLGHQCLNLCIKASNSSKPLPLKQLPSKLMQTHTQHKMTHACMYHTLTHVHTHTHTHTHTWRKSFSFSSCSRRILNSSSSRGQSSGMTKSSGLAVPHNSHPGRRGLLMNVHPTHTHPTFSFFSSCGGCGGGAGGC